MKSIRGAADTSVELEEGRPFDETSEALRVEVYGDWKALEPVRKAWDDLALRAGAGIYASFDWRKIWWEFYGDGRVLETRLVWRNSDLVAVFPFFREMHWIGCMPVTFLRLVGCDHAGGVGTVVVEPGMEDATVSAFACSLGRKEYSGWDVIHMGPLQAYNRRLGELGTAFARAFVGARTECCRDAGPDILLELPTTLDDYVARLSKRERRNIRHDEKHIHKAHEVRRVVNTSPGCDGEVLSRFLRAHERMWQSKGMPGWFNERPHAEAFHRRIAEVLAPEGRWLISELSGDGTVIASQYCFRFGNILHWFQATRDNDPQWHKYSLGTMGLLQLLREYAYPNNITLIDAGGSPIEYKLSIGGRIASQEMIVVTRGRLYSRLKVRLFRIASWILHTLYSRVWYRRVAPRLGLGGRPFSEVWIRSRVAFPCHDSCADKSEQ